MQMGEGEKMTALAVDLIRAHGPLTMGELHKLMPREWNNHLTGHPGQWLSQHLRYRDEVRRDPLTKQWAARED